VNEMNEKQNRIANILGFFSELYNKSLTKNTLAIYIDILETYDLPQIEKAFQSLVKEHALSRFPLPADFMKHLEPPEEKILDARKAWNKALDKMEYKGRWNTVQFDDPIIAHTIVALAGSWINFGDRIQITSPEDLVFYEKDFIQIYQTIKTRGGVSDLPQLEGRCDMENRAKVGTHLFARTENSREKRIK